MLKINSAILGSVIVLCSTPIAIAANAEVIQSNNDNFLIAQFGQTANQRQQAEFNTQSNNYQSWLYHQKQQRLQQERHVKIMQIASEYSSKRDYIGLGNLFYSNGYMRDAIAAYSKAIEVNPRDSDAYFGRAKVKGDQNDFHGAIADYDARISLNPKSDGAYMNRAVNKYKLGDKSGSLQDFRSAARIRREGGATEALKDTLSRIQYFFKVPE